MNDFIHMGCYGANDQRCATVMHLRGTSFIQEDHRICPGAMVVIVELSRNASVYIMNAGVLHSDCGVVPASNKKITSI
jgi:hypothetical protein